VFDVLREYRVPADPDDSDADVMEFGQARTPGVIHLVAESNGLPIGSAILTPTTDGRVKLSKLFLRPEYRGQGLGRRLLEASVAEARRAGHREIFLATRDIYREAVALYEASGWLRGPDLPPPGPNRCYYFPLSVVPALSLVRSA
jgi:GNAT superfamily N-acetyltransferase